MMRLRRKQNSLPTRFLALLLFASASRAAFENDFSSYPDASQECLYAASESSGCDGDTVSAMNKCLCGNGGDFVSNTAACLAAEDKEVVETVYDTLDTHCSDSGTPLSVSRAKFLAAKPSSASSKTTKPTTTTAAGTSTPTDTATNTPTSTPTSTATGTTTGTATGTTTGPGPTHSGNGDGKDGEDDGSGDGGLSSGAKRGIIAGSIVGGLALVGVLAFFFVLHRRRSNAAREESHPMLPQKFGGSQGGFRGSDVSGDLAEYHKPAQGNKWQSAQGASWESPYEAPSWGYPQPAAQQPWGHYAVDPATGLPVAGHPLHPQQPAFYELAGGADIAAPVEMGGTPIHPHPPGSGQQYSGADWGPAAGQPPRGA